MLSAKASEKSARASALGYAGAGAGAMDQNVLEFRLDALEGADVFGLGERELGRINRLVRSSNICVVLEIDTGWFGGGGTSVVPLQRFVWTGEALMLPGITPRPSASTTVRRRL